MKYKAGDKIGPLNLEIIERIPNSKVHIICPECGNQQWFPRISDVVSGKSKNCGCLRNKKTSLRNAKNYKDIHNQKFGYLIALKPTNKRQNTYVVWECLCTLCGKTHYANVHDLSKGNVKSCGCWTGSNGESHIKQWLEKHHLKYETQKTFNSCKNPNTNYPLRFDFYLPDYNCCIEYNGIQHYKIIEYFGGEKHYKDTIFRDKIKQEYCNKNNIKLIIIKYSDNINNRLEQNFE